LPEINIEKKDFQITKEELVAIYQEIRSRPDLKINHQIDFEELSTQERIQIILGILSRRNIISFSKTLRKSEGRHGVVVTFLASLELAKDGHVELIQNKTDEIFLKSKIGATS
jgi:segregation and condensation protein A